MESPIHELLFTRFSEHVLIVYVSTGGTSGGQSHTHTHTHTHTRMHTHTHMHTRTNTPSLGTSLVQTHCHHAQRWLCTVLPGLGRRGMIPPLNHGRNWIPIARQTERQAGRQMETSRDGATLGVVFTTTCSYQRKLMGI